MTMGNTERAWDKHYDAHYQSREAQAAVDAMAIWRQEMLDRPVIALQQPLQGSHAPATDLCNLCEPEQEGSDLDLDAEQVTDTEQDAVLVPEPAASVASDVSEASDEGESELSSEVTSESDSGMSDCYSD